jgi:glycogen debranching enzyme
MRAVKARVRNGKVVLDEPARRTSVAILLTRIQEIEKNVYQLDFAEGEELSSFTFVHHPERQSCDWNGAFVRHFHGRMFGRDAMIALGRVTRGEAVELPLELRR